MAANGNAHMDGGGAAAALQMNVDPPMGLCLSGSLSLQSA